MAERDKIPQEGLAVTVQPTMNEWDAPVGIFRVGDDLQMRRDGTEPEGWTHRNLYPHGVVLIDGRMSDFDVSRQPEQLGSSMGEGSDG